MRLAAATNFGPVLPPTVGWQQMQFVLEEKLAGAQLIPPAATELLESTISL